jgi:hypothetical protein
MPSSSAPLTVATDASVGHVRGAALAGTAWVSETGDYEIGICGTRVPLVGELTAIHRAVTCPNLAGPLTVLSDCLPAVHALGTVAATGRIPTRGNIRENHQIARLLRLIVVELRRRPIEVAWVKGHDGHRLNDVADRLAVQARRCAQNGGRLSQISSLADRIAGELRVPRLAS